MKPLVLCILDGVGIAKQSPNNAVSSAKMDFYNNLFKKYPNIKLGASGADVGLPAGTMGNSEVGHITIGTGRVVNQFLRRFQIENSTGKIAKNSNLKKFITSVKKSDGIVHILGMMSDGRVHSDINLTIDIMRYVLATGLNICIHFIADGRDTAPKSAGVYAAKLEKLFAREIKNGAVKFGTISGRYYAMDRNNNWERTQIAFDTIVNAQSKYNAKNITGAIAAAYKRGETDEFIKPTIINAVPITANDGLLFTNYRSDRARQILKSIVLPKIGEIRRVKNYTTPHVLCMSQYGEGLDEFCPALLPDVLTKNTLGDVLSAHKLKQLRIAETEKYNHVTYFFDAERTINFPREKKILINSPSVATFDMAPEMSAAKITDALLSELNKFDVIILNFANGDMVGHTGNKNAAIRAMTSLDKQLSRLVPSVLKQNGTILITADHGNVEKLMDKKSGTPWTAHTTNPVPFIYVSNTPPAKLAKTGGLADIAPTMLKILGIKKPSSMTGKSLV